MKGEKFEDREKPKPCPILLVLSPEHHFSPRCWPTVFFPPIFPRARPSLVLYTTVYASVSSSLHVITLPYSSIIFFLSYSVFPLTVPPPFLSCCAPGAQFTIHITSPLAQLKASIQLNFGAGITPSHNDQQCIFVRWYRYSAPSVGYNAR